MLNRTGSCLLLVCTALVSAAVPAAAQQTLNLSVGYFTPRGEDARVPGDVLNENRTFQVFDVNEFSGVSVGGEWLVPIGRFFEAGAGVSFSHRTVPTLYEDFVDADGTEIDSNLRLRILPVAFTLRVLPLGNSSPVQPYFGAGIGVFNWRYSESGEFVDFADNGTIFEGTFVAQGNRPGAVAVAGIRFGGDAVSAGGEVRYHKAEADLDNSFAGPKIDLGGWVYNFTLGFRFR